MNDVESAARSFFLLSEVSRLLTLAHQDGRTCHSVIKAGMTAGKDNPQTATELPTPTGGYEIHIVIDPPTAALDAT